jgi:hypothetical protein
VTRVYICHPYANAPQENVERVRAIARQVLEEGNVPIAPHLYLPQLLDEATERELAMSVCLELVSSAHVVQVYGVITDGMRREIARALELRIPVRRAIGNPLRDRVLWATIIKEVT